MTSSEKRQGNREIRSEVINKWFVCESVELLGDTKLKDVISRKIKLVHVRLCLLCV